MHRGFDIAFDKEHFKSMWQPSLHPGPYGTRIMPVRRGIKIIEPASTASCPDPTLSLDPPPASASALPAITQVKF